MAENELVKVVPFKLSAEVGLARIREVMKGLTNEASHVLADARALVVTTPEECKKARQDFDVTRTKIKEIEEARKDVVTPLNDLVKDVNSACKEPMEVFESAKKIYERKAVDWEAEAERIRKAEEQRLRDEAERKERAIREEKERQERAARAKEEAKRREAEELARKAQEATNAKEKARLAEEAEKARLAADKAKERADLRAIEAAEAFVPAPVVEKVEVKAEGTKNVTRWMINVVDQKKIPFEVEFNGETVRLWLLDEAALKKIANGTKGPSMIPGVEFYPVGKLS